MRKSIKHDISGTVTEMEADTPKLFANLSYKHPVEIDGFGKLS